MVEPRFVPTTEIIDRLETAVAFAEDGARETAILRARELVALFPDETLERIAEHIEGGNLGAALNAGAS